MFFRLTNSPATFQTMMNDIFREEIAEGWVVIYMDDILVFSKDKHKHQEQVKRILEKLCTTTSTFAESGKMLF
jgi:hypothetical protein